MNKVIAIDGPSGSGKSTMARLLGQKLGFLHVDSGALYRIMTLAALHAGVDCNDEKAVAELSGKVKVEFVPRDGKVAYLFEGKEPGEAIRTAEINANVSPVSKVPEVRTRMVALQRKIAEGHNVIMDGRDIGTHVLPNATLKIFLTASAEERARRRCLELEQKGMPEPYEKVLEEMKARDYQDTHRAASPLRPADDAVFVDTSDLDLDQSVAEMKRLAVEAISKL